MRILWTFVKVVLALAVAIPLSIIILATGLGILGALVGIAVLALKLAVVGFVCWGVFRLVTSLLRPSPKPRPKEVAQQLRSPDPHYEAAMREIDRELGETR
jgi:small-conductance mechanosensitive channel